MLKAALGALLDVAARRFVLPAIARGRANVEASVRRMVVLAICLTIAGLLALVGLVFLLAALTLFLVPHLGAAGAVATVGGGVVVLAAIIALVGTRSSSPPAQKPADDTTADPLGALLAGFGGAASGGRTDKTRRGGDKAAAENVSGDKGSGGAEAIPAALALTAGALLAGIVLGRRI